MLKPNEIEAFSMSFDEPMKKLENQIMQDIIRRIKINGEITRSADWQIHRLYEMGMAKSDIEKAIQKNLNLSDEDMQKMYQQAIESSYIRDEEIYKKCGLNQIPFAENEGLQQLITAVAEQTSSELKNISQSLGFAVKQPDGKLKFKKVADYYQSTLDNAIMGIASGVFDYNTAIKRAVSEMTNSGLRTIDYASGWSNRVDVATRRAIVTGLSQLTAKVNEDNAKALKTEYFEVSWHSGARPTHQEWQGKVYSKKELETVCGLGTVTGLCGANCYHDYYPFIPGISEPTYTAEELEEMNRQENIPIEYNGKKYTKYEALQRQRSLETTMRAQRQKIKLLEEAGADEDDIINARCRYRGTSQEYSMFSKTMDLPQQRERVTVDGLGNIGSEKYKKTVDKSGGSGIIKTKDKAISLLSKPEQNNEYSELGRFKQKLNSDERIDKDYYNALKEKFSHGTDTAKAVFNKFVPENSVENAMLEDVAYYNPNTKKISMHYGVDLKNERGACATWFHEHGHMIDDLAGGLSDNQEFYDLLRKDKIEYEKKIIHEKGTRKVADTYRAIEEELQDFRSQSGVSDIFNGLSTGTIRGCAVHDIPGYWNKSSVCHEAFAHMFESQFDEIRYREMKKYFPNALSCFENMLKGALK